MRWHPIILKLHAASNICGTSLRISGGTLGIRYNFEFHVRSSPTILYSPFNIFATTVDYTLNFYCATCLHFLCVLPTADKKRVEQNIYAFKWKSCFIIQRNRIGNLRSFARKPISRRHMSLGDRPNPVTELSKDERDVKIRPAQHISELFDMFLP